jgi:hypothetical protein
VWQGQGAHDGGRGRRSLERSQVNWEQRGWSGRKEGVHLDPASEAEPRRA